MAEKPKEKKPEAPAAPSPAAAGEKKQASGGLLKSTPVMLGVVMLVEAAVLFGAFKVLGGGPQGAHGADLVNEEPAHGPSDGHGGSSGHGGGAKLAGRNTVEIAVVDLKAPNKQSGRTFLYDVSIYIAVKAEHEERVKQISEARGATIRDRMRTIIAQGDPEKLGGGAEPGLETLRRQVKYQLDEIFGDGMIEEVLIPRCIPFRADF